MHYDKTKKIKLSVFDTVLFDYERMNEECLNIIIASIAKQSVRLTKRSLKSFAHKQTGCFLCRKAYSQ